MDKTVFGMVGGGWRTEFYLRIARALPERFGICGVVVRDAAKGKILTEKWGVQTYRTVDELLKHSSPSFVGVSVNKPDAPGVALQLAANHMPVLIETPPAPDLEGLIALDKQMKAMDAKIQVAEQYHAQPLHAARLAIAHSGKLGEISQAQVSVCHGYHAMSLMRRFLGLTYENATVTARKFVSPLIGSPDRRGNLEAETTVASEQVIGTLDFEGKLGIFDFTYDQYFSWIRTLRLTVRGTRGEIVDDKVRYLEDFRTPVEIELRRLNAGENGNLEGYYLKGILAGDQWAYRNPFLPGRLSDDEIAIASCLERMEAHVHGAPAFYPLAEACQDHYLALSVERALQNKEAVKTVTQPWATL